MNSTMDVDFPIDRCDTEEEAIKKSKWYLEYDPDKYEQFIDIDVWEVNKMSEENKRIEKDLRIDPESMIIETREYDAEKDRICSRRQRV